MHIFIVTDAWLPQVNGVVRTLDTVVGILRARGHAVDMVTPADFITLPCPTYPEIRLSLATTAMVGRKIEASGPDSIHLATEGPRSDAHSGLRIAGQHFPEQGDRVFAGGDFRYGVKTGVADQRMRIFARGADNLRQHLAPVGAERRDAASRFGTILGRLVVAAQQRCQLRRGFDLNLRRHAFDGQ
jgi:hypothetical protein